MNDKHLKAIAASKRELAAAPALRNAMETVEAAIHSAFLKGLEAGRDDFYERLKAMDPEAAKRFANGAVA